MLNVLPFWCQELEWYMQKCVTSRCNMVVEDNPTYKWTWFLVHYTEIPTHVDDVVCVGVYSGGCRDSKVHGTNMGPIWGRQDPAGPHVGPMNSAIWVCLQPQACGFLSMHLFIRCAQIDQRGTTRIFIAHLSFCNEMGYTDVESSKI